VTGIDAAVRDRYGAARTDPGMLKAGLWVEQVAALAYTAAAAGPLSGADRALAQRFAEQEREHAAVFETLLFALTVPVREHATEADVAVLIPGLADLSREEALTALQRLEEAAIAGQQLMGRRLEALDALRSVATVMAGGAQHLAVIRRALGDAPVVRAFESGT
jgi:Ferritin-like domain